MPESTRARPVRILIIDDEVEVLRMVGLLLAENGFEVYTSASPFGATNLAVQVQPDLLIIDYLMPALRGPSLVDVMRRNPTCDRLPVLLYSAAPATLLEAAVREGAADDYLEKGGDLERLVDRVKQLLAASQHPSSGLGLGAKGADTRHA